MTEHQPALQGGLDWIHPLGLYLGAWGSNVHSSDGAATLELDVYGGYSYAITPSLTLSTGALYYSYYLGAEANTIEIPVQASWKSFKLGASYSPHWGGGDADHSWYLSAGWSEKPFFQTTLAIAAGYSFFGEENEMENYADFRLGLSREMLGVTWDLSGYFVSHQQLDGADSPQAVLTVSKSM